MTSAAASSRTTWKGAISFGLVHIPIALYSATADTRPKFNLIDRENLSRVGNKQVNKDTGEAVGAQDIVKGYQVDDNEYVVLSKEDIRTALPRSTQLIEIDRFVPATDIPSAFFNKPYFVMPAARGHKPYLLLRDTLKKTGMAGIARVVVSTKQHLAALVARGDHLVLNLLRWDEEVRLAPALSPELGATAPTDRELAMAEQLVREMADAWAPGLYHDEFKEQLERLVQAKKEAGELTVLQALAGQEMPAVGADIIDLTELLRRSLGVKNEPSGPAVAKPSARTKTRAGAPSDDAANDETPARKAAAAKSASRVRATSPAKPRKSAG